MTDATGEIGVGLAEAIGNIRAELQRATAEGQDSKIGFDPGPVELEFQVGFQNTKAAGGGIRVWVVTVDAKADIQHSATHRLKFTLTPVRRESAERSDKLIKDRGTG